MTKRMLLLVLLAMLLAALTSWFSRELQRRERAEVQAQRHIPDYFLTHFIATTMNPTGQPKYRLGADRLVHYADTDTMELTRPEMVLFTGDWHARAAHGLVAPGGKRVTLSGGVEIYQLAADGSRQMHLATDQLQLRPDDGYAETNTPVAVTSPHSNVNAGGMRAWLKEDRIVLLSNVRGTYESLAK